MTSLYFNGTAFVRCREAAKTEALVQRLEASLAAGRQIRKEEDKQLRAAMREDQGFQQERKKSKPIPAEPERQSSGIFSTSGESLFHR